MKFSMTFSLPFRCEQTSDPPDKPPEDTLIDKLDKVKSKKKILPKI